MDPLSMLSQLYWSQGTVFFLLEITISTISVTTLVQSNHHLLPHFIISCSYLYDADSETNGITTTCLINYKPLLTQIGIITESLYFILWSAVHGNTCPGCSHGHARFSKHLVLIKWHMILNGYSITQTYTSINPGRSFSFSRHFR